MFSKRSELTLTKSSCSPFEKNPALKKLARAAIKNRSVLKKLCPELSNCGFYVGMMGSQVNYLSPNLGKKSPTAILMTTLRHSLKQEVWPAFTNFDYWHVSCGLLLGNFLEVQRDFETALVIFLHSFQFVIGNNKKIRYRFFDFGQQRSK